MTGESVKDENFEETIKKGEGRQCAIKCIDLHVGAAKLGSTVYRLHDSREARRVIIVITLLVHTELTPVQLPFT